MENVNTVVTKDTDVIVPTAGSSELDAIAQISQAIQPFWNNYVESQERQEIRRIALEEKVTDADMKWRKYVFAGGLVLVICIFSLAGILALTGREGAAVDLVQMFVAVAGAMLGGYGLRSRGRIFRKDDTE